LGKRIFIVINAESYDKGIILAQVVDHRVCEINCLIVLQVCLTMGCDNIIKDVYELSRK